MTIVNQIKQPRTTDAKEIDKWRREVSVRFSYITGTTNPLVGKIVPRYVSDVYYDSTLAEWWVSHGIRAIDWKRTTFTKQTVAIAAATFVQLGGNAVNDASTFDGYTLGQVVKALRTAGILN